MSITAARNSEPIVDYPEPIEFIDFKSDEGDAILCRMIKKNKLDMSKFDSIRINATL